MKPYQVAEELLAPVVRVAMPRALRLDAPRATVPPAGALRAPLVPLTYCSDGYASSGGRGATGISYRFMISIRLSLFALLVAATLPPSFAGCTHQQTGQKELSQIQVRQLATKYRDEWLNKNPTDEAAILARGIITLVERVPNGWHVVFVTETGHSPRTPEGIHDHYLHVYLRQSGELDRVVRGPDTVS